jgi:hypothetical protein
LNAFNGEKVEMISCGAYHSLALTESGEVYSWGRNDSGRLGIGKTNGSNIPNQVIVKDNEMNEIIFKSISCGLSHSILLSIDGEIYTFGSNESKKLGFECHENQLTPKKVKQQKSLLLSNQENICLSRSQQIKHCIFWVISLAILLH